MEDEWRETRRGLAGVAPPIPRAARAGVGGDSAGAAPTPIRAAAHGEPSVRAFSRRCAPQRLRREQVREQPREPRPLRVVARPGVIDEPLELCAVEPDLV